MDLSTRYMGLSLQSPIVPAASPLSKSLDTLRAMQDAGAGAVVLWSLFEEQIKHDADELEFFLEYGADRFAESLSYYPKEPEYILGPEQYLAHIEAAKKALRIPVIASLNGITTGGWIQYARKIQDAGADAIELNVYYIPTSPTLSGQQVEEMYVGALRAVKSHVTIPVAMKLSPFLSATAHMARRLAEAGADGLVLFNRFYQPDLDVEELEVRPRLSLSTPFEMRLPLRWVAILHGKIEASLAGSTGVQNGLDVAKMILAGADIVQVCSALMRNGVGYLAKMRDDLQQVMREKDYDSVQQMKGVLSQARCAEPAAFERANYMKTLESFGRTATLE